ncbi:nitric oxide synthase-related [Anaeramoeba flamelloides]|uniref:Nitric oxide synthase-related n=1 Tax=Anaeramoeba flamelloides TaxID=1746091 RepID=A0AAV7Y550_9EUKA|nr:nitric oxide synthase-related [Anaeramoeba flamelloides]
MIKSRTLNKIIGKNLSHKFLKDFNQNNTNLNLTNNDNIEVLNYQNIFNSNITEKQNDNKQGVKKNESVVKKVKNNENGDKKDLENNNNQDTNINIDDGEKEGIGMRKVEICDEMGKEKGGDEMENGKVKKMGRENGKKTETETGTEKETETETGTGTGTGTGTETETEMGVETENGKEPESGGDRGKINEKENENEARKEIKNTKLEEKVNNDNNNNQGGDKNKSQSGNENTNVIKNDKNDDKLPENKNSLKMAKTNERRNTVRKNNHINFEKYKNNSHIFQAETRLDQKYIHLLTMDGGKACQQLQRFINMGNFVFDYIEVRACPFGCLGGGGHLKTLENPINQRMKIFQSLITKSKIPNFKKIKKRYYNVYCGLKESKKFRNLPIQKIKINRKQDDIRKKKKQTGGGDSHGKHSVLILWGSQTGIAREIANVVYEKCKFLKLKPRIKSLQNFEIESLSREESIIFVISTYWEGSFPTNAVRFWKQFNKCKLNLTNLKYSVIGIGNSSYTNFNKAAILLDNRIEKLGANRLFPISLTDSLDPRGYWTVLETFLETLKYI